MDLKGTESRFWAKVDRSGECWIWTAARHEYGYGLFSVQGKMRRAHRVAYLLLVGPIPEGRELHHTCDNPACVRPRHLEPLTHAENIRLAKQRKPKPTHCPRGHAYDEENTYAYKNRRSCRRCRRTAVRESTRRRIHASAQ